ncbi:MAG: hypothetical protein ABS87_14545 [Sphingomonas sp. SCN 67-18]|nr:flavin reductase family protein [Sphingomonas sp. SCN 67-18]ODU18699.1 MAG: hypothetical protein ABS87_14545 [Sphingomonas sp. SCN 67-18]
MTGQSSNPASRKNPEANSTDAPWIVESGADADAFRAAMRRVIAGVTIITTRHDDNPWGMTVSAFTPVCMDPPTLLVCVNNRTVTAADILRDRRFGVNLLSQAQLQVSQLCARQGEHKFLDGFVVEADALPDRVAMPVLKDSIVSFDCEATDILPVGTHLVVIARIGSVLAPHPLPPLLYGEGRYLHGVALDDAGAAREARA